MDISGIHYLNNKTIYAPATLIGFSGVAIIRISGPKSKEINKIFKIHKQCFIPRYAHYVSLKDENNQLIDNVLLIFFPGPNSFTGEDIIELQTHGSPAVIKKICEILSKQNDFSLACPGEFSKRALINQKIDLVQAEGLLALIHAQTNSQLLQANRELSGEISNIFSSLREEIIEILAKLEALIDFPEDDLDDSINNNQNQSHRPISKIEQETKNNLYKISQQLNFYLQDNQIGEKIKSGFEIAIIGKPNVGKSSLLNHLIGEELAIVSPIAGTTRDLISTNIDIAGYLIKITDTAGIHQSNDLVEQIGIKKAIQTIKNSDLVLILFQQNEYFDNNLSIDNIEINHSEIKQLIKEKNLQNRVINILTKMDHHECSQTINNQIIPISVHQNKGIENLKQHITNKITQLFPVNNPIIGSQRQRQILEQAKERTDFIIQNFERFNYTEILTEEIRNLALEIASLTSSITGEEVLDNLFNKFCIGK